MSSLNVLTMNAADLCVICQEPIDHKPLIQVRLKGIKTLINYSKKTLSQELHEYILDQILLEKPKVKVHKECRSDFTNPLRMSDPVVRKNKESSSSRNTVNLRLQVRNLWNEKKIAFCVVNV